MYAISVDLPLAIPDGSPLPAAFPVLAAAVEAIARQAEARWLAYAYGEPLPDGRSLNARSGEYARSIQMVKTGEYRYTVEATVPYAGEIERGAPARDMKRMLSSSLKVRVGKRGQRYLIIPFRHGTPGTVTMGRPMPDHIHEAARQLGVSRVTGVHHETNQIGVHSIYGRELRMVKRRSYKWGDRLKAPGTRQHGMVRFNSFDNRHSTYMTFRTMSENSPGWIRPAVPGFWVARAVEADIRKGDPQSLLQRALAEDVRRHIAGES
jgi:hypothetical protein